MSSPAVIVVDDDSALLTAMTGLMELHMPRVHVEPFCSPRLALARFQKKEVAVMVTDLKMDEMDGLALLSGAKALRPNVPVILVSGHVDSALASQAIHMGAQDVLQKPFNRQEFLTVLTAALETYTLAREVRIRRLMTERLGKRMEGLKRLIEDSWQRPNTIRRIQKQVSTSRQLTGKSLASLETSLDRLWQYANLAQARLDVAQQRLIVRQQASRDSWLKRIACQHES
jgi:two-component system, NtrC family, C4-dicarboxylate transport response regulator DctD